MHPSDAAMAIAMSPTSTSQESIILGKNPNACPAMAIAMSPASTCQESVIDLKNPKADWATSFATLPTPTCQDSVIRTITHMPQARRTINHRSAANANIPGRR